MVAQPSGGWREVRLTVGEHTPDTPNRFEGNTLLGLVPAAGLRTTWIVRAINSEIRAISAGVAVSSNQLRGRTSWIATFELLIPANGPTAEQVLHVAESASTSVLEVTILVGGRVYRELSIVVSEAGFDQWEREFVDASGADVRPPHEWTTPPAVATIIVKDERSAYIQALLPTRSVGCDEDWPVSAEFSNHMSALRRAADMWRTSETKALDAISPEDLERRLRDPLPSQSWADIRSAADEEHEAAWAAMAAGANLRQVAARGFLLFELFFPPGTERRSVIDELPPGSLITIRWDVTVGAAGGVPWALMFTQPPGPGPISADAFFGIRFRIEHLKYSRRNSSLFLGTPSSHPPTSALYWNATTGDTTGVQSAWHRSWQQQPTGAFLVVPNGGDNPKQQVLSGLLGHADGSAVVYMYCECGASSSGGSIALSFGINDDTRIEDWELLTGDIPNSPLAFANACDTGRGDAYNVNMLEQHFVTRGCRAFIGTETKVPIILASRFARIFFYFLESRVDGKAMHAGEAMTLTRRFLWQHYRNLGGLLYSYVNQYRLVLADPDELESVVRW